MSRRVIDGFRLTTKGRVQKITDGIYFCPLLRRCPICNRFEVIKFGIRRKKRYSLQLFRCNRCNVSFIDPEEQHRRVPKQAVIDTLEMKRAHGLSLRNTLGYLDYEHEMKVHRSTLCHWQREFNYPRQYLWKQNPEIESANFWPRNMRRALEKGPPRFLPVTIIDAAKSMKEKD